MNLLKYVIISLSLIIPVTAKSNNIYYILEVGRSKISSEPWIQRDNDNFHVISDGFNVGLLGKKQGEDTLKNDSVINLVDVIVEHQGAYSIARVNIEGLHANKRKQRELRALESIKTQTITDRAIQLQNDGSIDPITSVSPALSRWSPAVQLTVVASKQA